MSAVQMPEVIGRYAVHGELAAGGMAAVHYARLLGPSGFARTVVVKRPHPYLAKNPEFAAMLIDEARLSARIHHPNVVSILDVIETPTDVVLVMEYIHGEALSSLSRTARSKAERIPIPIAAAVILDALHGLHAAHDAADEHGNPLGLVHRDVSPQNLLVGVDGLTRIVDFGIAKATGRSQITREGIIKGKFAYMAPEQARGEEVSRVTDVFAASVVFWELLTGQRLFAARSDAETMHRCLAARIRAPSVFARDLPPRLDAILLKGLCRDPDRRYQSALELARDIEGCLPAVRPSQVGGWVQSMAGDALAARSEVIAVMERELTQYDQAAHTLTILSAPPSNDTSRLVSIAHARRSGTQGVSLGTRKALCGAAAIAVLLASGDPPPWSPPTQPRPAAALHGGAAVQFPQNLREQAERRPEAPPVKVVPTPSLAILAPPQAPRPKGKGLASRKPAYAKAAVLKAIKARAGVRKTDLPRPPPQVIVSCDPPYRLDLMGRKIFTLECL